MLNEYIFTKSTAKIHKNIDTCLIVRAIYRNPLVCNHQLPIIIYQLRFLPRGKWKILYVAYARSKSIAYMHEIRTFMYCARYMHAIFRVKLRKCTFMYFPRSNLEICDFCTLTFSPNCSWVRFLAKRAWRIASPRGPWRVGWMPCCAKRGEHSALCDRVPVREHVVQRG